MSSSNKPSDRHSIEHRSLGISAVLWAILLAILWGGTSVSTKYSLETMEPFTVSCLRFVLGSIFVGFWCVWDRESLRVKRDQIVPILILGVFLFFQIGLFTVGMKYTLAAHGSLLINTYIFWVAGIEHFVTGHLRLKPLQLLGLLLASLGVILIFFASEKAGSEIESQTIVKGDVFLSLSALLLGIKVIYTKVAMKKVTPGNLIFWHNVVGVILFAIVAFSTETLKRSDFGWYPTMGLLYQGVVVAGFCFVMHATLLKKHSASQLSVFSFVTPVFGVVFAVILLGEEATIWLLFSGIAVATGIALVNFTGRNRTTDRAEMKR